MEFGHFVHAQDESGFLFVCVFGPLANRPRRVSLISASHYRNRALCRAPTAHGKERKTHGTAFAVRILPKRTAKGARRIFTR
jgi:hypothetical protein